MHVVLLCSLKKGWFIIQKILESKSYDKAEQLLDSGSAENNYATCVKRASVKVWNGHKALYIEFRLQWKDLEELNIRDSMREEQWT